MVQIQVEVEVQEQVQYLSLGQYVRSQYAAASSSTPTVSSSLALLLLLSCSSLPQGAPSLASQPSRPGLYLTTWPHSSRNLLLASLPSCRNRLPALGC